MHKAVDALALTDNRNLLLPHLIINIALARVPRAGAVEESVTQRDELDSWRRRCARFHFQVGAVAGLDSWRRAGIERDGLVRQPRQAHTRIRNFAAGSGARPHRVAPQAG